MVSQYEKVPRWNGRSLRVNKLIETRLITLEFGVGFIDLFTVEKNNFVFDLDRVSSDRDHSFHLHCPIRLPAAKHNDIAVSNPFALANKLAYQDAITRYDRRLH